MQNIQFGPLSQQLFTKCFNRAKFKPEIAYYFRVQLRLQKQIPTSVFAPLQPNSAEIVRDTWCGLAHSFRATVKSHPSLCKESPWLAFSDDRLAPNFSESKDGKCGRRRLQVSTGDCEAEWIENLNPVWLLDSLKRSSYSRVLV